MNLVLIGYRGAGKSEVGALLAKRLARRCVATDAVIVEKYALSIPEIVARDGWPAFRDVESDIVRDLAAQDNLIIDTGGGVVERQENVDSLRAHGCLIWLKASVATIISRIADDKQRPSLTGEKSFTDEVAEVLERRNPLYHNAAHYEIDTDQLTPVEIMEQIVKIEDWCDRNLGT